MWLVKRHERDEYLAVDGRFGHESSGVFFWTSGWYHALRFERELDAQLVIGALRDLSDHLLHARTMVGLRTGDARPVAWQLPAIEANPAWLIECGSPAIYYCGEGDWCSNANHAHRFVLKEQAEAKAATMTTMEPVRVAEHVWDDEA